MNQRGGWCNGRLESKIGSRLSIEVSFGMPITRGDRALSFTGLFPFRSVSA